MLEADPADETSVELKDMVEPPNAVWTVGALAIGVTEDPKEIVVVAQELPDQEDDAPSEAHIHISYGQAKPSSTMPCF